MKSFSLVEAFLFYMHNLSLGAFWVTFTQLLDYAFCVHCMLPCCIPV